MYNEDHIVTHEKIHKPNLDTSKNHGRWKCEFQILIYALVPVKSSSLFIWTHLILVVLVGSGLQKCQEQISQAT